MKKIISVLVIAVLAACNNDSNEHDAHHNDSNHSSTQGLHSEDSSKSMKQLMEINMQQMMGVRSAGNADYDFAALMKIHHQGAVDMANALLKSGTNEELRKMAQQIIIDQQKEITIFDSLLATKKSDGKDSSFYKKSMNDMHHMHLTDEDGSIDREFIQMMIPHHEGAIVMAKTYLHNGAKDATLKKMANNIIKTQQEEINTFKQMLANVK